MKEYYFVKIARIFFLVIAILAAAAAIYLIVLTAVSPDVTIQYTIHAIGCCVISFTAAIGAYIIGGPILG